MEDQGPDSTPLITVTQDQMLPADDEDFASFYGLEGPKESNEGIRC